MKNMSKNLKNKIVTIPIIVASISVFCFFLQNPQIALSQCKLSLNGVIESTTGGFKFPDGTTQTTAGGVTITQQASAPTTMAQNDEVTVIHPSVTNHKMSVNVFEEISSTAQSDTSLDFDEADESNFTQEDSTNGTDFDSGFVTLHSTSGTGNDSYTKLMLHMNGTDGSTTFTDDSGSSHTVTANGNAQIDTAQSKFGGASGLFDGTGDYLSIPDSVDFEFGSGDWTVDFWFNFDGWTPTSVEYPFFVSKYNDNTASECEFMISYQGDTDKWMTRYSDGSSYNDVYASITWTPDSSWHHMAVVRKDDNLYYFIDGTQHGTTKTISGTLPSTSYPLRIGSGFNNGSYYSNYDFQGHIDELRISKGIARWTSNFTPPSLAYSSPTYPTSQAYYITTASGSQIDTSVWEDITGVTLAQTTPTNTSLLYLVSFDGRTTWKYWTGSAWASSSLANLQTDGMNKTTLEGITQAQWGDSGGFTAGTLDFAVDLKTTVSSATSSLDLITVNYNLLTYEMASTGKYGSSSDYGVRRKNATQTTFKKLSTGSAKVYLNVFTY